VSTVAERMHQRVSRLQRANSFLKVVGEESRVIEETRFSLMWSSHSERSATRTLSGQSVDRMSVSDPQFTENLKSTALMGRWW